MLAVVPGVAATMLSGAFGYLIGSVPIGNIVAQRNGLPDLRDVGDCNPGYWNAKDLLGTRVALPILIGDVAKGAIATVVGSSLSSEWWAGYVAGGAAMIGHSWPIFAGFRGGRSVLAFVGVGLVISPTVAATALAISGATALRTRNVEWAARAGVFAFPFAQLAIEGRNRTAATGALMTLIGIRFASAALKSGNSGHATPVVA
jgi:glycerol-3-phosphate acyltransferase PlsY